MSNIAVRKENEPKIQRPATAEWDPARWMQRMMQWDPFQEMTALGPPDASSFAPAFEIKETKDSYVFKADVPGVKAEDVEVNITGNRLTISGKREAEKQEKTDRYYTYERTYGSFARAFTLPDGTDANSIHAHLDGGVLSIDVAKKPEAQPKKIDVRVPASTPTKA